MWSATWPKEVQTIADEFLKTPYKVIIGSPDLKANHNISQVWSGVWRNRLEDVADRHVGGDGVIPLLLSTQVVEVVEEADKYKKVWDGQ